MSKLLLALVTAVAFSAACGDSPHDPGPEPEPAELETVEIDGPTLAVHPGDVVQLTARAYDTEGAMVPDVDFTWSSDDVGVATVSDTGLLTAITAGEVTISADAGPVSGGLLLVVEDDEAPAIARLELEPGGQVELSVGETLQLTATAYADDGEILLGRALTWMSGDPDVAIVSANGVVTGLAAGSAWIAVEAEGQRDEMLIQVPEVTDPPIAVDHVSLDYVEVMLPVGQTMQLVATPRDAQGQPLARPVTWSSNNPLYVSVSATGLVTALDVGGGDITATSEGKSASVRVWADLVSGHTLMSVGGTALPTVLGSYTETFEGVPYRRTLRVFDGWMLVDNQARTYEIVITASLSTTALPASVPLVVQFESTGSVSYDAATATFTFTPMLGEAFTGRWVSGGLEVLWQPEPRLEGPSRFGFGAE